MEFPEFYEWVKKELRVSLNSYKPTQLNRRIGSLMERKGIKDLQEYKELLKNDKTEREAFLDYVTINVTEFFRNPEFFDALSNQLKKEIESNSNKKMKIWSAGCSLGCEAYSLSMLLNEMAQKINYSILATDIDLRIMAKAKEGKYSNIEIKSMDKKYLDKYFTKEDDKYIVDSKIKSKVIFKKQDLILDKYDTDFDLIVCRNVLIYFKDEVKNEIIRKFVSSLRSGGILFVGATESINSFKEYGLEKLSPFIYKKV